MSWRYKGGFIQEFFNPLTPGTLEPNLFSWGINTYGNLGQNNITNASSPTQVGSSINWSSVVASSIFAYAIKTDGTLWAWGYNADGELGLGDGTNRSSPTQVGALTTWLSVGTLKQYSTGAIKTDGTLWTWGVNNAGSLGTNNTGIDRSSPVQVGAGTTWSKVTSGSNFMVATKTDGSVWSWGSNLAGQLGQNIAFTVTRSSPVQIGALTTWSTISAGYNSVVATKTDGTVWSWGSNAYGQLGISSQINRSSPVQIGALTTWLTATSGQYFVISLKTDGSLWSWGQNSSGQLGLSRAPASNSSSPIQIGSLTNWTSTISCGTGTVFAKTSSGTLFGWGNAGSGALGDNTTQSKSSPIQIGSLTSWSSVASGSDFSVAIAST